MKYKILITGSIGFIGFHLARSFLNKNKYQIIGIDNIDNYYSTKLKKKRLKELQKYKDFEFQKIDICNRSKINDLFKKYKFKYIFHLAAQAGVRYSLINPKSYVDNNISGFFNILDYAKEYHPNAIFYASSSSVYGERKKFPLKEIYDGKPKNIYALSKKFNEELAKIYADLYNLKIIGLRFFTVYGEWGRPDMFYLKYLLALKKNKAVKLYNYGKHIRDFTYIDDVVEIINRLIFKKIKNNHEIFNICSNKPIQLKKLIKNFNIITGKKAKLHKVTFQKADVLKTHGDNSKINRLVGKKKYKELFKGLKNTYEWFKKYHSIL